MMEEVKEDNMKTISFSDIKLNKQDIDQLILEAQNKFSDPNQILDKFEVDVNHLTKSIQVFGPKK